MSYLDEIAHCGPKDIYEKAVLSLNTSDALEFLLLEVQHKQRLVKILSTFLKQELGESWWQMYADHIVSQGRDMVGVSVTLESLGKTCVAGGDIPI